MKFASINIVSLFALAATGVAAVPATPDNTVAAAFETDAGSAAAYPSSDAEFFDDDDDFVLSDLLPELFPDLVARGKKKGCMGGSWKACHDWTVAQCPVRCTGMPRRRHRCTQRCLVDANLQCQKACK